MPGQNFQQLNQFQQLPILGDTATKVNLNTLSVQIDPNSTNTLQPGDAVYMTTTTGTTILVDKCSATTAVFGYVLYSIKFDQFVAGDNVEIGTFGQILWLLAGGTISRDNYIEYDPSDILTTGPQVLASAGTNPISGLALDNATIGELIRIYVLGQAAPVTAVITGGSINNTPIGATTASTGNFTSVTEGISVLTPGTTISLNPTLGNTFTLANTTSGTINAASVPASPASERISIIFTADGSSEVITFGTHFKSTGTLALGSSAGKIFVVTFVSDGTNFNEASRTTAE